VIEQTTIARSHCKCPALWVIRRQRGEGNGIRARPYGNLMSQEESE